MAEGRWESLHSELVSLALLRRVLILMDTDIRRRWVHALVGVDKVGAIPFFLFLQLEVWTEERIYPM